jgi:hypothetical protein
VFRDDGDGCSALSTGLIWGLFVFDGIICMGMGGFRVVWRLGSVIWVDSGFCVHREGNVRFLFLAYLDEWTWLQYNLGRIKS